MESTTSFFFGPYLEIKVRKTIMITKRHQCKNGHLGRTKFCPTCGESIQERITEVLAFPVDVYSIIDDIDEEAFSVCTPPSMFGTGTIIVISNGSHVPHWLLLVANHYDNHEEMKPFPTAREVQEMIDAFTNEYADEIAKLNNSPLVVSVEVKAGYLLDKEY